MALAFSFHRFSFIPLSSVNNDKCVMAVTTHGGHLGYLEGGGVFPNPISWSDKVIVQYLNVILDKHISAALIGHPA